MPSKMIAPRPRRFAFAQPGPADRLPLASMTTQFASRLMAGIAALLILLTSGATIAQVWFSGDKSVAATDLPANRALQSIPLALNASALAVDSRSGYVWALTSLRLGKYSPSGQIELDVALKDAGLDGATVMAVDGRDSSLWIGEGNGNGTTRSLSKLNSAGSTVTRVVSPDIPDALAVDMEGVVWLLAKKRIYAFSPSGQSLAALDANPIFDGEPKFLAVDAAHDLIWLAGEKRLIAMRASAPAMSVLSIALPEVVRGVALDAEKGVLWALTEKTMLAFDASGQQIDRRDLAAAGVDSPRVIVFEPSLRSSVVAHNRGLTRFPASPLAPITLALVTEPKLLAAGSVDLRTTLALETPQRGSLINRSTPDFVLNITQACSGNPCTLPLPPVERYRVSATLNGSDVGSGFTYEPEFNKARYRPLLPLPENLNTFQAEVTDAFGNRSNRVSATFSIDTIAPVITDLLPATGSVVNTTSINITGGVSEPATLKVAGQPVAVTADRRFATNAALIEGVNSIVLEAIDAAGNTGRRTLAITLDTVPPAFIELNPAPGFLTNRTSFEISGRLSEGATLGLGQETLVLAADNSFTKVVALVEGNNDFVLHATDRAGNVATRSLRIIRDTIAPRLLNLTPADGTAVNAATVHVSGAFDDAVRVTLTGAVGSQSVATAVFAFELPLQPGANAFSLKAIDAAGNETISPFSITRTVVEFGDAPFFAVWDGMNAALRAGNIDQALTYLTSGAKEKYRPVFSALIAVMPTIIGSYSRPSRGQVTEDMAEYAIMRFIEADGDKQVFFIYFVKSDNGIWLIESM